MNFITRRLGRSMLYAGLLALTALFPLGPTRSVAHAAPAPAASASHSVYLPLTTQPDWAGTANLFVDPVNGKDTNPGTQKKPLKTLAKALAKAKPGCTIHLADGGYGPAAASGEQFPPSGLVVPAGVTIEGALDSGFPVSTLVGTGGGVGLNFAGDATVRNLTFGGSGFGVGMFAKQGTQTLSNIFLGVAGGRAVVDGAMLSGGIVLRGTAQATLLAGASGANTTGSTIFLNTGTGVNLFEQARFTMDGGDIIAGTANCRTGAFGIVLNQAAQATLKNIISFQHNVAGTSLEMNDTSRATLSHTLFVRENPSGCTPRPSVHLRSSASLTLQDGSALVEKGNLNSIGISTESNMPLTMLSGSSIGGYATGIDVRGTGKLTLDSSGVTGCQVCINAAVAGITITNSHVAAGSRMDSVGIIAPTLKMRNSQVDSSFTGIVITGPSADLGTLSDPGNNKIIAHIITGVQIDDHVASGLVSAVGNTWNPNTQGADASGQYTTHILVNGLSPLAQGLNFDVQQFNASANVKIQL